MNHHMIEDVIRARRSWIDAIAKGFPHAVTSKRWEFYVNMTRGADTSMGEFEDYLKKYNQREYNDILRAK